jgi:hypothetical protein
MGKQRVILSLFMLMSGLAPLLNSLRNPRIEALNRRRAVRNLYAHYSLVVENVTGTQGATRDADHFRKFSRRPPVSENVVKDRRALQACAVQFYTSMHFQIENVGLCQTMQRRRRPFANFALTAFSTALKLSDLRHTRIT